MSRETIVPSVPDIRQDNTLDVLRAIKSTIDVREGSIGDPLDQNVTLRDLADLNLVLPSGNATTQRQGGGTLPVLPMLPPPQGGYNPATDFTVPPAPVGLRAKGGLTNVYLDWDGAPYRNHGYTEIWRSSADSLSSALFIGTSPSNVYADPVAPDTTYFYWIRFVSAAGVAGPYNQTSGTPATTALDVSAAISAVSSAITSSQLFRDLGTRIDGIEYRVSLNDQQQAALIDARARLEAEVTKNGSGIVALDRVTALQATSIKLLGTRVFEAESTITNLQTTTASQALSLVSLTTRVGGAESNITNLQTTTQNQAQSIVDLNTSIGTKNKVFFQPGEPVSSASYTLRSGDLWYDTDDNNKSYRHDGASWVAFVNAAKIYYQTIAPVAAPSAPLFVGDLWYDSDDDNHPYRWNGSSWVSLRDGYINARVVTLEQTKIGYATLNSTGMVFDNGGTIIDKTTADAWNAANPGNQVTWHVGLPFATAVKQVSVSDGSTSLTLEQRFTAQKQVNNELYGQYTVKIDNRGHVTGFGLASGTVNGAPSSAFIVRADRFGIAGVDDPNDPLGTLAPTSKPFLVTNVPTVVNGKTYPAGTWIDTAFIANATITSAQITDLTADKITAGTLSSAMGVTTGKLWGGVAVSGNKNDGTFGNLLQPFGSAAFGTGFFLGNDGGAYKFYVGSPTQNMNWNGSALAVTGTINAVSGVFRNITVYDSQDRVILSSGGVNTSLLGLGALAAQDDVPYDSIAGTKPPADATRNVVFRQPNAPFSGMSVNDIWFDTDDNATYYYNGFAWVKVGDVTSQNQAHSIVNQGALATQSSVFIGSTVKIYNPSTSSYDTLNTGDFVNRLTKIGTGNISSFISDAAIGDAYIGNLNAAKITAGTIAADRLDSGIITAKVANLDAAVITAGFLNSARIASASIDTLKLQGNAVTVSTYADGYLSLFTLTSSEVTVCSTSISISGLDSGQTAGTIFTGNVVLYENGGSAAVIEGNIYVNGALAGGAACALGESKTITANAFVSLGNGSHTVALRIRTAPGSGGAATKSLIALGYLTVISGKR